MHHLDIFYSILQETHFFSSFFYRQYILDLEEKRIFDIKTKSYHAFSVFCNAEGITELLHHHQDIVYTNQSGILIKPNGYPQYRLLLYPNPQLVYLPGNPVWLPDSSMEIISNSQTLEKLLYKNPTYSIYIVYFDFYSNQDLSTPSIVKYMMETLQAVCKEQHCYFYQDGYNSYYLLCKEMEEIEVMKQCIILHQTFIKNKKEYLYPRFLIVEYDASISQKQLFKKMKSYYKNHCQKEDTIITKENVENLI